MNILQEMNEFSYSLEELNEDGMPKKLKIKGRFGLAGAVNGNHRIYPESVLGEAINGVQKVVGEKRMLGELDHPADAKIHLDKVSHVITKLEMRPNGEVYGEAEVLPTAPGKILEALLRSGVKLGISSRGFGSTRDNAQGLQEVQNDYRLVTFDIVSDPSAPGAFPNPVYESKENKSGGKEIATNLSTLLEEVCERPIVNESEKKEFVCKDDDGNRFYIVEGEYQSYGYLNFHASHHYHVLVKNEKFSEKIGLNESNMKLIEKVYGSRIINKLSDKITEIGIDPNTLKVIKEEL